MSRSRVSRRLEETAAPAGASHGEADLRGGDQQEVSGFRLFLGNLTQPKVLAASATHFLAAFSLILGCTKWVNQRIN